MTLFDDQVDVCACKRYRDENYKRKPRSVACFRRHDISKLRIVIRLHRAGLIADHVIIQFICGCAVFAKDVVIAFNHRFIGVLGVVFLPIGNRGKITLSVWTLLVVG